MKNAIKSHGDAVLYLLELKDDLRYKYNEDRASETSINRAIQVLRFMHKGSVPIIDVSTHNNGISLFFSIKSKKFWQKIKPDGSSIIYQEKDGKYVRREIN